MKQIQLLLFEPGGMLKKQQAFLLAEKSFFYAGQLMALSLFQGGPNPLFFCCALYKYLISNSIAETLEPTKTFLESDEIASQV